MSSRSHAVGSAAPNSPRFGTYDRPVGEHYVQAVPETAPWLSPRLWRAASPAKFRGSPQTTAPGSSDCARWSVLWRCADLARFLRHSAHRITLSFRRPLSGGILLLGAI